MAIEVCTLSRNGGSALPLRQWGFSGSQAVIAVQAGGDDYFAGDIPADETATPAFAFGDKISIFNGAGTRVFVGWVKVPVPKPETKLHSFEAEGPNRWLADTHVALWPFYVQGATAGTYDTLIPWPVPTVYLNRSANLIENPANPGEWTSNVGSLTVAEQADLILRQAKASGNAGSPAPFDYDLTGLPTGLYLREQVIESLSCAEALARLLQPCTGISWHWDHRGTGNPMLRFVRLQTIADDGTITIPPTLSGAGYAALRTLPNNGTVIAALQPECVDQRIGTLRFSYVITYTDSDGTSRTGYYSATSTVANGSHKTQNVSVPINNAVFDGTNWVELTLPSLDDLPRFAHQALAREWWKFNFSLAPGDARWDLMPGDIWNISSAAPAWATAFATCQTITRNLFLAQVSVKTGPPTQRGIGDMTATVTYRQQTGAGTGADSAGGNSASATGKQEKKTRDTTVGAKGADGADGATPTLTSGSLQTGSAFELDLNDDGAHAYTLNLTIPDITFSSVTVGTTSGSSSGSVGGSWSGGFTLSLYLNLPTFSASATSGTTASVTLTDGAFAFVLEKGEKGRDGYDSTVPGPKGDKGDSGYASTVPGPPGPPGEVTTAEMHTYVQAEFAARGL